MANGNQTPAPAGQAPSPGPGGRKKINWKKIGWVIVGLSAVLAALMYDQFFRNRDEASSTVTVVDSDQPPAASAADDEEGEELEQQLNAFPGPCGNCK